MSIARNRVKRNLKQEKSECEDEIQKQQKMIWRAAKRIQRLRQEYDDCDDTLKELQRLII